MPGISSAAPLNRSWPLSSALDWAGLVRSPLAAAAGLANEQQLEIELQSARSSNHGGGARELPELLLLGGAPLIGLVYDVELPAATGRGAASIRRAAAGSGAATTSGAAAGAAAGAAGGLIAEVSGSVLCGGLPAGAPNASGALMPPLSRATIMSPHAPNQTAAEQAAAAADAALCARYGLPAIGAAATLDAFTQALANATAACRLSGSTFDVTGCAAKSNVDTTNRSTAVTLALPPPAAPGAGAGLGADPGAGEGAGTGVASGTGAASGAGVASNAGVGTGGGAGAGGGAGTGYGRRLQENETGWLAAGCRGLRRLVSPHGIRMMARARRLEAEAEAGAEVRRLAEVEAATAAAEVEAEAQATAEAEAEAERKAFGLLADARQVVTLTSSLSPTLTLTLTLTPTLTPTLTLNRAARSLASTLA